MENIQSKLDQLIKNTADEELIETWIDFLIELHTQHSEFMKSQIELNNDLAEINLRLKGYIPK